MTMMHYEFRFEVWIHQISFNDRLKWGEFPQTISGHHNGLLFLPQLFGSPENFFNHLKYIHISNQVWLARAVKSGNKTTSGCVKTCQNFVTSALCRHCICLLKRYLAVTGAPGLRTSVSQCLITRAIKWKQQQPTTSRQIIHITVSDFV